MGAQGKRDSVQLAITGASQEVALPLSLGRINQIVVTSDQTPHSFSLSLENEDGDIILGPRQVDTPDNDIRPDLLPIGKLTAVIADPIPASGTVTISIITQDK